MQQIWPHIAVALTIFVSIVTSGYVILYKRDSRSAVIWVAFIWLTPVLGSLAFLAFGVNRIRIRARALRGRSAWYQPVPPTIRCAPENSGSVLPPHLENLETLADFIGKVVEKPLIPGNDFELLVNGDEAYPEMLDAIRDARKTVTLSTYIFDNDPWGQRFADALGRAVARGVQVRVLIDDAGAHYSWPSIVRLLRDLDVPVARFLPTIAPWRLMTMNMRNHRKILVLDGQIGFTGGMNIRQGHVLKEPGTNPKRLVQDLQFRIKGPVVYQLQECFANDWFFCTRERLEGPDWFPEISASGAVYARTLVAGPDNNFEKLRWAIQGALACAQKEVKVVTPYFIPDQAIISALNVTAMRGVSVDIVLPSHNNLPYVDWASRAMWWQVLERGCRIWLTPGPFDHSKLLLVDNVWSMVGSANWDTRSLRLNFELNLECYGTEFAAKVAAIIDAKMKDARPISLKEMDRRPLAIRLRDGVARLLSPYL
ncbi:MAG TPA: cardiolipin synthase [Verrucomicrobiae bacterium]|nr:cardiolipin synthase [Verrucomicrobiae bacterium]